MISPGNNQILAIAGIINVIIIQAAGYASAQNPYFVAYRYIESWKGAEYSAMYGLLYQGSKTFISRGEITETIQTGQTTRIYYRLHLMEFESGESLSQFEI